MSQKIEEQAFVLEDEFNMFERHRDSLEEEPSLRAVPPRANQSPNEMRSPGLNCSSDSFPMHYKTRKPVLSQYRQSASATLKRTPSNRRSLSPLQSKRSVRTPGKRMPTPTQPLSRVPMQLFRECFLRLYEKKNHEEDLQRIE